MVNEDRRTLELLRQRDRARRAVPVWVGLAVVWGVVVGWVIWGAARVDSAALAWTLYLVPLLALLGVAVWAVARVRRIDRELVRASRGH